MNNRHFDAIIVGTGPSGATAAYELARSGLRTLLLEKEKLPRYKTCGGGVTAKAARALPFPFEEVRELTLSKLAFTWKTGREFVRASPTPLVHMVQRSRFDNLLSEKAAQAGAQLLDQTPAKSVEVGERNVTVETPRGRFSADYLVGADGATGRVARSLGLMSERWALAALESEVEVEPDAMQEWQEKLSLDIGWLPGTYGWVFPKGDHLSVGVGGLPLVPDYGSKLKAYDAAHTAARVKGIRRVIRSHGYILPCRRPGAPVQKGRALLVGDAAGLVEAFTGEGIYWAIRSGRIAASAIAADQGRGRPDYTRALDEALMPDLLSARRWMRVYVSFPRACYSLPKRVPAFWRWVCLIIRGERRYTDIRRRLGPAGVIEGLLADPLPGTRVVGSR